MKSVPILVTLLLSFGVSPTFQTSLGLETPRQHGQVKIVLLPLTSIRLVGNTGGNGGNDIGYKQEELNKVKNYGSNQAVIYDEPQQNGYKQGSEYGQNNGQGNGYGQSKNDGNFQGGAFQTPTGSYNVATGIPGNYEASTGASNSGSYGGKVVTSYNQALSVQYSNDRRPDNYRGPSSHSGKYDGRLGNSFVQPVSLGYGGERGEQQHGAPSGDFSNEDRRKQEYGMNFGQGISGNYGRPREGQDYKISSSQTASENHNWQGNVKPSGYENIPQNQGEYTSNNGGRNEPSNEDDYALASQGAQEAEKYSTVVGTFIRASAYGGARTYSGQTTGSNSRSAPAKANYGTTIKDSQGGYNKVSGSVKNNNRPIIIVTDYNKAGKQISENYGTQSSSYPRVSGTYSGPTRANYYAPTVSYSRPINGPTGGFKGISQAKISSSYQANAAKPNSYSNAQGSSGYGDSSKVSQVNSRGYSRAISSSTNYGGSVRVPNSTSNNGAKHGYTLQNAKGENNKYETSTRISTYKSSELTNNGNSAEDTSNTGGSTSSNYDGPPRTEGLIPIIVIQSFNGRKLNGRE